MKIQEAVIFTDGKVVRIETDEGKFYLDEEKKVYDMHPINVMAKQFDAKKKAELFKEAKKAEYHGKDLVTQWL